MAMKLLKKKNSVIIVTILVLFAKLIAMLREFVLSYFYGISSISDAYNIAYAIPITVVSFVAIALNTSYIPIYNNVIAKENEKEASRFSNSVLELVLLLAICCLFIIKIFVNDVVGFFGSGLNIESKNLAIQLTQIMSISVLFICINQLMAAYIQLKNKYYFISMIDGLLYFFSILGIICSYYYEKYWLAIGVLLGYIFQTIMYLIISYKLGYRFKLVNFISNKYLYEMMMLVLPVFVGALAADINKVIGKSIATQCGTGSVSVLSYAHKIDEAIITIMVSSVVALAYPKISKFVSMGEYKQLHEVIILDLEYLCSLIIPLFFIVLFYSKEIVILLFVRGAFTVENAIIVANVFMLYAIGLIPTTIRKYYVRIFYAFSDTKLPAQNSLFVIFTNIILSLCLYKTLGVYGIATASTISLCFGAMRLILNLKKHINIQYILLLKSFVKILTASFFMIVISKSVEHTLLDITSYNIAFISSLMIGIIIYLICLKFLKMTHLFNYIRGD